MAAPGRPKTPRPPSLPSAKSTRNSANKLWIQEQQRRTFIHHLTQWSLSHDSSAYFQGRISLMPQSARGGKLVELGKSVTCIFTDNAFTDARQKIVIRLFAPQNDSTVFKATTRRDSLDPGVPRVISTGQEKLSSEAVNNDSECECGLLGKANGRYKLVVRCGAGWMSARDYFSRVYFSHLESPAKPRNGKLDLSLAKRSQLIPQPCGQDGVTIRPLFHPFQRLPAELQDLILSTAAGITRSYNLCANEFGIPEGDKNQCRSPISLSTLFRVSKAMNEHLVPHVLCSTDFEFGLTGFTHFLWQSGPIKRPQIRRLTFHFGKLALLHCIRWLAPTPVFALFQPPVTTNPPSLQYFWRCQIQDLIKELHLFTLTIDTNRIPKGDLPMVAAILKRAFGSVDHVRFIETTKDGVVEKLEMDDERLSGVRQKHLWGEMCAAYYVSHARHSYFYSYELSRGGLAGLESAMDCDEEFFVSED